MRISRHFTFEASHVLPEHTGKCAHLHGHSYGLDVVIAGQIDPATGFVMDYTNLNALVKYHVIDHLDHTHLGQGSALSKDGQFADPYFGITFYPSAENLARAIFKVLQPLINDVKGVQLVEVIIEETANTTAAWSRDDEYYLGATVDYDDVTSREPSA